jgi:hypothetical protein
MQRKRGMRTCEIVEVLSETFFAVFLAVVLGPVGSGPVEDPERID